MMGGTAVNKWHNRKNTAAEGYEIRGEFAGGSETADDGKYRVEPFSSGMNPD
jgi:hypothetical protein